MKLIVILLLSLGLHFNQSAYAEDVGTLTVPTPPPPVEERIVPLYETAPGIRVTFKMPLPGDVIYPEGYEKICFPTDCDATNTCIAMIGADCSGCKSQVCLWGVKEPKP